MTDQHGNEQLGSGSLLSPAAARLLNEVIQRLESRRATFTEDEALMPLWEAGYEVSPQIDSRFVLARESEGKHKRHWRLWTQTLANDRLLDALTAGTWDGYDRDEMLEQLDAADQVHYVFCPVDPRFIVRSDGRIQRTEEERDVLLPDNVRVELDGLASSVLTYWQAAGSQPHTVQQITIMFGNAGWEDAQTRESWLLVKTWLQSWEQIVRVGHDYWVPASDVPRSTTRSRLQVLPVALSTAGAATLNTQAEGSTPTSASSPPVLASTLIPGESLRPSITQWTVPLRMIHVLEGFVPVPAQVRSAYPPRSKGEGDQTVVRARLFESDESIWLWLDRAQDRLYGPDLLNYLAWCEAGDVLRVQWAEDVVVLRIEGRDASVYEEETRLVDRDALASLRGGLGESYRASIQHILAGSPEGLPFADVVAAVDERQGHVVHRGTIRALLVAGGFIHREARWFAAPDDAISAKRLRAAMVDVLATSSESHVTSSRAGPPPLRIRTQAIQLRLASIIQSLNEATSK